MNKSDIRKLSLDWRLSLSDADWTSKSQQISTYLEGLPELQSAKSVHAFWPILAKREVDIRRLLNQFVLDGKNVWLPIMAGSELVCGKFEGESSLKATRFGVLEPAQATVVEIEHIDVVLIPALAIDKKGNRIGYGKGFYDGFLSRCNAVKIVPIFENQIVDGIPSEPHDVSFDIFATEQRIQRVSSM